MNSHTDLEQYIIENWKNIEKRENGGFFYSYSKSGQSLGPKSEENLKYLMKHGEQIFDHQFLQSNNFDTSFEVLWKIRETIYQEITDIAKKLESEKILEAPSLQENLETLRTYYNFIFITRYMADMAKVNSNTVGYLKKKKKELYIESVSVLLGTIFIEKKRTKQGMLK